VQCRMDVLGHESGAVRLLSERGKDRWWQPCRGGLNGLEGLTETVWGGEGVCADHSPAGSCLAS
jgi:hypothetical protein